MSTILKTLKKLEEEKSVLEKRLDLKDMVLQDEDSSYSISSLKTYPRFIWGGTLFFTGVAVTAFWLWVDKPQNMQIPSISPPSSFKLRPPVPVKKQTSPSVPGIPLSNIPEQPKQQPYSQPTLKNNNYSVEKDVSGNKLIKPVVPIPGFKRGAVRQEEGVYEIQSLIASAKLLADEPEETRVPQINKNLFIPGLKVKGIIFFSSGSPSNHIFVSTPKSSNQKARVGDSVESATLLKIEPNAALFSYKGDKVHLEIGE
jgi:hypothetical protein|tara:strand:- start:516 stop:1286 length:771 start_codon:yes stop_codon:yes gene_type:complete